MFAQQKKLTHLNIPVKRLRRLYVSTVDVQLALPDFPSQMASAYLAALASGKGIQILLGLYLAESGCSVFFLPESGEVTPAKADAMFVEGLEFAESMGFVLADADVRQMRPEQLDKYWRELPVCRKPSELKPFEKKSVEEKQTEKPLVENIVPVQNTPVVVKQSAETPTPAVSLEERRVRCKESLGRFLASL